MAKFLHASARRLARRLALQALYQWHMTDYNVIDIERQFVNDNEMAKVDQSYFHELLHQIPTQLQAIDNQLKPYLDREIKELNIIELMMLRIGCYELMQRLDIPYKVVINEAVALTKKFGTQDGYKYVNGVLDNVAKNLRTTELS